MRIPERGEKGFTLIELLIVVAILGVLAAVVIPNVGRFIGRGETEAAQTEWTNIQSLQCYQPPPFQHAGFFGASQKLQPRLLRRY